MTEPFNQCQSPSPRRFEAATATRHDRRSFLAQAAAIATGMVLPHPLRAQGGRQSASALSASHIDPTAPYPQPVKNPYPYTGISGAGYPVDAASGRGGWRSGSSGVAYRGEHPYPCPLLPWNDYATGSAVTEGLIPALQPLIDVQVRDTIVCRGGDGNFYLTGSTGENIWAYNRGVEMWRSPDLVSWSYMGLVWDLDKEGTWERAWRPLHDKPSRAIWAPEIHYLRGNYFICLSMAPAGISILKSTTGKPQGPYIHAFSPGKSILEAIEPTLFEDTDGKVYFTAGSATRIARLKDDLSGLAENFRPIVFAGADHIPSHHETRCVGRGMNDLGTEGAVLFKANGLYYLGAADTYEGRYSTCLAISESLYGPYHTRHESVPCGGGTGFFQDHSGHWWSSYFGNDTQSPFREKPAIVKVDFASDARVVVSVTQPFVPGWRPGKAPAAP